MSLTKRSRSGGFGVLKETPPPYAAGTPAPSAYDSGDSRSRSRESGLNQDLDQTAYPSVPSTGEAGVQNNVDKRDSGRSELSSSGSSQSLEQEPSLTCCHRQVTSIENFTDSCKEHIEGGGGQTEDSGKARFGDYLKTSGFSQIIEACVTRFAEADETELPPYNQFSETLATLLGYTLPLRTQVEQIRSFNESLREKIRHLQAENVILKTKLDEYVESVESLDALDPDQFHPNLHPEPLPAVQIRRRFHIKEKLVLKEQEFMLRGELDKMTSVDEANKLNSKLTIKPFGGPVKYPTVHRDEGNVISMHGVDVPNPYEWFEAYENNEISKFLRCQEEFADRFLKKCELRESFGEKLLQVVSYKMTQCPLKFKDYYYYLEADATAENVPMLYRRTIANDTPEMIFDFATVLCADLLLESTKFNDDGSILAYIVSDTSHCNKRLCFYDVLNNAHIPDILQTVTANFAFVRNSAVVYEGDAPDLCAYRDKLQNSENPSRSTTNFDTNPKLLYHMLGTHQELDTVLQCNRSSCIVGNIKNLQTTPDSSKRKLIITLAAPDKTLGESVFFVPIPENDGPWYFEPQEIISRDLGARFTFISKDGPHWYFITDKYAENGRIVDVAINHPDNSHWKWRTVVREEAGSKILWAACFARDKLMICYLEEGRNTLVMTELGGAEVIEKISLEIGSIRGYSGRQDSNEFLFHFTSFLVRSRIYRLHFSSTTGKTELKIFSESPLPGNDPEIQKTDQLFYPSKDSTVIPIFVIYSKGGKLCTQPVPCLLSAFGGFGLSITPAFSSLQYTFLQDFQGIIAIPLVRGGGELGKRWHTAGVRENKYKSVEDLVAAAQFLIARKYTTPSQLFVEGTSHGGFLAAAALNQRPDLFAGAIIQSGILDLIQSPSHVNDKFWKEDFGDPKEDPQDFTTAYKLSPIHNINSGRLLDVRAKSFPAIFLLLEKFESQILSLHSYKFISELQYQLSQRNVQTPGIILRTYCSIDCPANKMFTNQALLAKVDKEVDMLSFMYQVLHDLPRYSGSTQFTPATASTLSEFSAPSRMPSDAV